MSRKPNSNSLLDSLPPNQQAALEAWLFEENLSYKDAVARLWQDFSVRCAPSTLSEWRQRRAQSRTLERIATSSRQANAVTAAFQANPANTYDALLNLIGQATFDARMSGQEFSLATLKDLADLTRLGLEARHNTEALRLKERDLELKERRVKLLEEKAKQAEATERTLADPSLTPEERQQQLRQIFGMA